MLKTRMSRIHFAFESIGEKELYVVEISKYRSSSEKVSNCSEETKENCRGKMLFREILAGFVESAHQNFLHLRARILATRARRSRLAFESGNGLLRSALACRQQFLPNSDGEGWAHNFKFNMSSQEMMSNHSGSRKCDRYLEARDFFSGRPNFQLDRKRNC